MAFKLFIPPSSIEVSGYIDLEDIITDMVDLSDLDQEPTLIVVARVPSTTVQAQGPVHILTVVEYIKALVTYHQEHDLDMVKLGTLLDHA